MIRGPRLTTRPRPVQVLHLLASTDRGGAEARTLDLLRRADPERSTFHFGLLSGRCGELNDEIVRAGGKVHRLPVRQKGFAQRFCQLVDAEQIDCVYSHVLYASGYLLRLARRCGVPVRVAYFRSSRDGRNSGIARRIYRTWMRRWMNLHATHILAVSEGALAAVWGGRCREDPRCRVIYDGIEPAGLRAAPERIGVRREFEFPESSRLYVHVGRFATAKNHSRLVRIFARLAAIEPEARLLLVGGGDAAIQSAVERQIGELGIAPLVRLAGPRDDVPRLLASADLMFFPSLWEGLGNVVIEASATGTPTLASDLPSVREMAARLPGVFTLPLEESDERWARTACELAAGTPSAAARAAAWEAMAASVFTIDHCLAQHERIWNEARKALPARSMADV